MNELQTAQRVEEKDFHYRDVLTNRLDLLEIEEPRYVFATKDLFSIIIRNSSGSDIIGGLSKKPVLSFGPITLSVPGYLNRISYYGLIIYDTGHLFTHIAHFPDGSWTGIGRRSQQDIPLEKVRYGFNICGKNHFIYPFENQSDAVLVDRITKIFKKFGTFELDIRKKSRFVKPGYDFVRNFRRVFGLQHGLEQKVLNVANRSLKSLPE